MMRLFPSRRSQSRSSHSGVLWSLQEHFVPRFFFHATEDRRGDEEYNMDDGGSSDTEPEVAAEAEYEAMQPEAAAEASEEVKRESPQVKEEVKEEEVDPSLADWFTVNADDAGDESPVKVESDSETEPDSENEDVKQEDEDVKFEDDDDWSAIGAEVSALGPDINVAWAHGVVSYVGGHSGRCRRRQDGRGH